MTMMRRLLVWSLILGVGSPWGAGVAARPGGGSAEGGDRLAPIDRPPAAWVAGVDAGGAPTLLRFSPAHPLPPRQARASAEAAARWYLGRHAGRWGLDREGVEELARVRVHDTGRGGILVAFTQAPGGIERMPGGVRVLMDRGLRLVAIGGGLHPAATEAGVAGLRFDHTAEEALAEALLDLTGDVVDPADLVELGRGPGDDRRFGRLESAPRSEPGGVLTLPARVREVWLDDRGRLVPGYYLEVEARPAGASAREGSGLWAYLVSAVDLGVVERRALTLDASYRVFAQPDGDKRPLAGPHADVHPHPTGVPDGSVPAAVAPVLISLDGFNTNPQGGADPWLEPGALNTTGNNVDAYADLESPDGYTAGPDVRGAASAPGTFDHVRDPALAPDGSATQIQAAITHLFYVNNWLHDAWYDAGFDEDAGVGQRSNLGRGGVEGDPIRAEALDTYRDDPPQMNNANMSVPADGVSPRMQMYVWGPSEVSTVVVDGATPLAAGTASFGPSTFDTTAPLALAADQSPPATDGCSFPGVGVSGKIAVIDRGACNFIQKVNFAQAAGAKGVIIVDNEASASPPGMSGDGVQPTIGVLSITQADGNQLKARMQAGAVTARILRRTETLDRDGSVDTTIIAHEWGHYLHHRLTWSSTAQTAGESEGWADFVALHLLLAEGDDRDATYGVGTFAGAAFGDAPYFGIRRFPYSTDPTRNPLTFKHIQDGTPLPTALYAQPNGLPNSESHNAGEIWATLMWEAYNALLDRTVGPSPAFTFAEGRQRMAEYVVTGMMLAPVNPTFTEQRDAILAAAWAADGADALALAEGFARRGAGTCATSPDRDSTNLTGVVEDFGLAPLPLVTALYLELGGDTCDGDDVLDPGEDATLHVTLTNGGFDAMVGARLVVSTADVDLVFPDGTTAALPTLSPGAEAAVGLPVRLAANAEGPRRVVLDVGFEGADLCPGTPTDHLSALVAADTEAEASNTETQEVEDGLWSQEILVGGDPLWLRAVEPELGDAAVFYAPDPPSYRDASLASPPLQVGSGSFTLTLRHRYKFEKSDGTSWDGGLIEASVDGGASWSDLSTFVNPGYNGTITNQSGNPLANRPAFTGSSPGWPAFSTLRVEVPPSALSNQTLNLRFRIGADAAVGDFGWEIDDITLTGLRTPPFTAVTPNALLVSDLHPDEDGDGFGAPDPVSTCDTSLSLVADDTDCNDGADEVYPGAPDPTGDGIDQDCDGALDVPTPTPTPTEGIEATPTYTVTPTQPEDPTPSATVDPAPSPTPTEAEGSPSPTETPSPTTAPTPTAEVDPTPTLPAPTPTAEDTPTERDNLQVPTPAPTGCSCEQGTPTHDMDHALLSMGAMVLVGAVRRRRGRG